MQNNKLGKVAIDTSKRPRARFNLPYDVNTTSDWGSVQPLVCRMMYPNTKNVVQAESLVRMAPLLNPTFGRVAAKQAHQFVDIEDIWEPWPAFYARKTFNGYNNYVPMTVPCINQSLLSLFILVGAKFTIYESTANYESEDASSPTTAHTPNATRSESATRRTELVRGISGRFRWTSSEVASTSNPSSNFYMPVYYEGRWIDWCQLLSSAVAGEITGSHDSSTKFQLGSFYLPSGNPSEESFFDTDSKQWKTVEYPFGQYQVPTDDPYNEGTVNLEGADYVLPRTIPTGVDQLNWNTPSYIAIRLSSIGKRIRKILLGCGYQIDFNTTRNVSLLPLMAFYKAYYDLYGVTQESNYEQTLLARFSNRIAQQNHNDLNTCFAATATDAKVQTANLFKGFMLSLGDCFYTEQQDYISAHTTTMVTTNDPGVGSYTDIISTAYPDSNGHKSNFDESGALSTQYNQEATITDNPFGHIDIVMLQKLYKWVNSQSIAGRQIAAAIKAQGFESYLADNQSNFIGSSESIVPISDVVSTSNTYDPTSNSGSILGTNGGRGIGYDEGKTFTYETDRFGYWIGMFAIVPKSGYSQGLDPTLTCLDKFDFYNSEFDGLGFEADDTSILVGGFDFPGTLTNLSGRTFGIVPTYTRWKVAKNIQNGDFNLRSTRLTYESFCLDKEIPSDDHEFISNNTSDTDGVTVQFFRTFDYGNSLPIASPDFRYVGKYPWIGTFDRIFANFNQRGLVERLGKLNITGNDYLSWSANSYDNFLVHIIVNLTSYAPMKPIEDSYILEDGASKADSRVEKS